MQLDDVQELIALGIPLTAIAKVAPTPMRVSLDKTGKLYEPDPVFGAMAYVFPVHSIDPCAGVIESLDPLAGVNAGPVIDLTAFHPHAPGHHALRLGVAQLLGSVRPQSFDPEPVLVSRDVTTWLQRDCHGIVLLAVADADKGRLLREIVHIEAEDQRHAAELNRLLSLPVQHHSTVTVHG
jgi:hypothetical protein